MKFIKMHGLGNDFIVIDATRNKIKISEQPAIIKRLCDRRQGIGADQMLLILPSNTADYRMRIFNADGEEVEMCGNGIRCVAKYLTEQNPSKRELEIETLAGIIKPKIKGEQVEVDMGIPILEGSKIPVNIEGKVIDRPVSIGDIVFHITCVSMGNPHCVIFCNNVFDIPLERYGAMLENHSCFPKKTNVEFVEVVGRSYIKMRVWERGAGITSACGTGACASAVASVLNNKTGRRVNVSLDGGALDIIWDKDNHVYMTGPAHIIFWGEVSIDDFPLETSGSRGINRQ